jgi:hypothetical protein
MTNRVFYAGMVVIAIALFLAAAHTGRSAQQPTGEAVRIDSDDIGGVVTSAKGPFAATPDRMR